MSSNEESDDDFQSADEDIDFEPHSEPIGVKSDDKIAKNVNQNSGQLLPQFDRQLNLTSVEDKQIKSIASIERKKESQKTTERGLELPTQSPAQQTESVDIKLEDNETNINTNDRKKEIKEKENKSDIRPEEQSSNEIIVEKNVREVKTEIKGRRVLRKADRLKAQTINDINEKIEATEVKEEEQQKIDIKTKDLISNEMIDENKVSEVKTEIKGPKTLPKVDRIKAKTTEEEENQIENKDIETNDVEEVSNEEIQTTDIKEEKPQKTSLIKEEQQQNADIKKIEQTQKNRFEAEEPKSDNKAEEPKSDNKAEEPKSDNKAEEPKSDNKAEELISNDVMENKVKEIKTEIKGRKLLRKADRLREQTTNDSEISEEKKFEVLNKLSDLSERDDSSTKWNNWFSDIKSAAMTASSTTVNHVSQASNKWSLNPKSLLTSAVSITSNVGSGISSVVENVSSVMDSAIGAPPPEQMAALANKDSIIEETATSNEQNVKIEENQSKSSLGFGFLGYTLNRLENIGKKTMEVMVDDKHKKDFKYNKTDKND